MIAHLEGILAEKTATRIIVDVKGVGYELLIPVSTFQRLGEAGKPVKLRTYLNVREDALQLFGFSTLKEKLMFLNLISVSGVGPKLGLSILSGCQVDDLRRLVVDEDLLLLTRLPGVGKKTAQRLIVELKDKMAAMAPESEESGPPLTGTERDGKFEEAVLALVSLGYSRNVAERVVMPIVKSESGLPLDEIIRKALQSI